MILPLHIKPNKIPRQTLNLARNFCFYEFIQGMKQNGGLRRLPHKCVLKGFCVVLGVSLDVSPNRCDFPAIARLLKFRNTSGGRRKCLVREVRINSRGHSDAFVPHEFFCYIDRYACGLQIGCKSVTHTVWSEVFGYFRCLWYNSFAESLCTHVNIKSTLKSLPHVIHGRYAIWSASCRLSKDISCASGEIRTQCRIDRNRTIAVVGLC